MAEYENWVDCPICGSALKIIDHDPFQLTGAYDLVPYGCVMCGFTATFNKKFIEDYLKNNKYRK